MTRTLKLALSMMFVILAAGFCTASDIYVSQSAAGANSGADCADAHAVTWFNTAANWGANANQIGPGTTVHLCGTFNAPAGASGYLTVQSSGTNGNHITLFFEPGTILTAPYWTGAAIDISGNSYITVNGGSNGVIQATANGSALANQQDNGVCVISRTGSPVNVTIENLTCSNIYVDSSLSDNGGQDTYGFDIWNASNMVIQNNTIHDTKWGIRNSYANGVTYSNLIVTGNNIYNIDHAWFGSDSNSNSPGAVMSGFYIYGNTFGSMVNWDNSNDDNHHDWVHLNTNSTATRFTNFYEYNNFGSGDPGVYNTSAGFFSYPAAVAAESGLYVFNNVFVNTSTGHCLNNGFISLYYVGATTVVNNTFVSLASTCHDSGLNYNAGSTGITFENNIVQNTVNAAIYALPGTTITASNYNDFYQSLSWYKGTWFATLTGWQTASGFDANSTTGNPALTSSYHLSGSTSAAWQKGANLYSICNGQPNPGIGALCSDNAGVARSSSANWDIGAYYDSGSSAVLPPSLLHVQQVN